MVNPSPWRRLVKYTHHFPACRMRPLKWCPDASASTAWNYAGLLCNLYRDAVPKRCQFCHHYKTSRAQSPLNPFYTWCNMLLTGARHSPIVSIPLLLPSNSSMLPLHLSHLLLPLMCRRVEMV